MAETPTLTVIRMWAAVAWADGVIASSEADGFRRLIDASSLNAEERAIARSFLLERVDLADVSLGHLSEDARAGIYRAACRMALADNNVAAAERALLTKLGERLGVTRELSQQIEATIPGFPRS